MIYLRETIGALAIAGFLVGAAPAGRSRSATPTYAKDIAPILNAHCGSCHSESKIAPFSLVGYENARNRAQTIVAVTHSNYMPPWKAKAGYGDFRDVPTLSKREKELISQWAKGGTPEGDESEAPAPPKVAPDWRMGRPDIVVTPELETKIPAEGKDFFRDYLVDPKITTPTWVRIIDFRPTHSGNMHHIIPNLVTKEEAEKCRKIKFDHDDHSWDPKTIGAIDTYNTLGFWSTGAPPFVSPSGTAFLMKPGDSILLDVHYKSSGKPETEKVKVAFYIQKETPKDEMKTDVVASDGIYLEPKQPSTRVYAVGRKLGAETTIYAVWPHMHYLGRTIKAWVLFPSGTSKPLVCVNDWDPDWQLVYYLKQPLVAPKGSRVIVTGTYDNSEKNPRNPHSPPQLVSVGESSSDEMLFFELFEVVKKTPAAKK